METTPEIEAVARAMIIEMNRIKPCSKSWAEMDKYDKEETYFMAIAAIRALREPTDNMYEAGKVYLNAYSMWVAMIDAALGENK